MTVRSGRVGSHGHNFAHIFHVVYELVYARRVYAVIVGHEYE